MINEYIWVTIYLSHLTYSYILRIQVILVSLNEKRKEKKSFHIPHLTRLARSGRITKWAFEWVELNISFKISAHEINQSLNFFWAWLELENYQARLELNELELK